jgi:uncharacterized membrane protein YjfL (UPF0719 family)
MGKIFLILLLVSFVFAQDLGFPSQKLPPIICEDVFKCVAFFFDKILKVILVLALALSTIFIAWAGILYITKGGGEEIKKIHQMLVWAAIGLIVALLSFAFVKYLEGVLSRIGQPEVPSGPLEAPPEQRKWLQPGAPSGPLEPSPGQRIWLLPYLFNFVYAQIQEPIPPESLNCGGISIPSVFQGSSSGQNILMTCLLYYAQKILSLLYILALMMGVIFIALAGISYIVQPQKSKDIHQKLIYGIIGIVIAILSFTIVKIIDAFFTKK